MRPPNPRPKLASSSSTRIIWLRAKIPNRDAGSSIDIPCGAVLEFDGGAGVVLGRQGPYRASCIGRCTMPKYRP
jgi:hypothetical protein